MHTAMKRRVSKEARPVETRDHERLASPAQSDISGVVGLLMGKHDKTKYTLKCSAKTKKAEQIIADQSK